jgi:hypothetical protein
MALTWFDYSGFAVGFCLGWIFAFIFIGIIWWVT